MDFIGFITALFNDWIARMSGGASIVLTILGFIPHKKFNIFSKPNVQRWIFWCTALLCFFVASVSVWTNEHQTIGKLEMEINNLSVPKLDGTFEQVFVAPAGNKNESSLLTIMAIIKNTGAQSIVSDFGIIVKAGNKQTSGIPNSSAIK